MATKLRDSNRQSSAHVPVTELCIDSKFESRIDRLEVNLIGKLDRLIERMDQLPTNLDLVMWAGGFIYAVTAASLLIVALLLRANGHPVAA
jgi:hypothetical protein